MRIDAVSDATFTAEVLESEKPVLVDSTAAWCPPCRAMNPILDDLSAERDDIKIVSVDVDSEQELASQWGVLGMPTFILFHNGAPIQQAPCVEGIAYHAEHHRDRKWRAAERHRR